MVRRGAARPRSRKRAVLAFGGNALVGRGEEGKQRRQAARADALAKLIVRIVRRGHDLVLVHGNGPQVGHLLIQVEEAVNKVPPSSVDLCVAQTEGSIGYLLSRALRNALSRAGMEREVVCLVTEVVVDSRDPLNREPSKPIGPFYTSYRASQLRKSRRWEIVEDAGRGFRRVVPSPRPLKVLGIRSIREALGAGSIVIAGGGGGVPVVEDAGGMLRGFEAVIDKDFTASLIATEIEADLLLILTDVDAVRINYGKRNESVLSRMTLREAGRWLRYGHFPPGSMGPKVEAAMEYVAATRNPVIITSVARALQALQGRAGTWITAPPLRRRR